MRAYALIHTVGGIPDLRSGDEPLPLSGYCLGASGGGWGMYLISGTQAQLVAVDALPNSQAVGICTVSQLPDVIGAAKRTELNNWTDTYFPSLPTIPTGATYQQVVDGLFHAANVHYVSAEFFLKPGGLSPTPATIQTIAVSYADVSKIQISFTGTAKRLIVLGDDYAIWQVNSNETELMALHLELWKFAPVSTLGLLAVVDEFGVSFYENAVMNVFDHSASELLERRDRIASYLESLGYANTAVLREATNEHDQMEGIVTALGFTMNQLWGVMVNE